MGYTHYFKQNKPFSASQWEKITHAAKRIVLQATLADIPLGDAMGEGCPIINTKTIELNGKGDDSYESFVLNRKPRENFEFCKTAHKPYDPVVVSILHVARTVAPGVIDVSSDGGPEAIKDMFDDGHENESKTVEFNGIEVTITTGKDGLPLVIVDTPGIEDGNSGPKLRVRLNDELIFNQGDELI